MCNNKSVEILWKEYLASIGEEEGSTNLAYIAWYFGGGKDMADELAELVLEGHKRATTSLHYLYEVDNEELPRVGDLSIVTDFEGNAKCIIRTEKVTVLPFSEVGEDFAYREGEGDKSLDYWQKAHIYFFNQELSEYNMEFSEDMLVVCEEFEVIYK